MPDREKVIAGLKECLELLNCIGTQSECKKYVSDALETIKEQQAEIERLKAVLQEQNNVMEKANSMLKIAEDKINKLLKEQEAKPPTIMQDVEGIWSTCSMCGHKLRPILVMKMDTYFPKFCSECGQAVKWE